MFRPVSSKFNVIPLEDSIRNYWTLHRIFAKSGEARAGGAEFVFYEDPPTANDLPDVRHARARAFRDVFLRYKLMRGYHVIRRAGWNTHGLPVEIGVEKKLGFTNKAQIEAYGIERFNELCRQSAFEFIQDWERFNDRIGYWLDTRAAYVTDANEYIESVWWILKTFWERGMLYQAYQVVPYCPRCGTPLSDHEVAQGCRDAVDPSIIVRMPLVDEPGTSLLVWTTAPWSLPANVAVAAHPEVEYVTVERALLEGGKERLILARPLVEAVFRDERVRIVDSFKGKKLKGRRYKPLFTFLVPDRPAHRVVLQEFVPVDSGTGLVHIAPAFGAEDMRAAQENNLPTFMTIAADGTFIADVRPWSGQFFKDADPAIIEDLDARGLLVRAETITHAYPFCWRCSSPLLNYARSAWYIRTSQFKERLERLNQEINWVPAHIKNGRFGSLLENSADWALSRERFWGTPLPIWECSECHHQALVGSLVELSKLSGSDLSKIDLHRPFVDQVELPCPECPGTMRRVKDLIDVGFDSGSMPVAQWHFPFENRERFRSQFPADFICEGVEQTHGWFYSLHAIAALLFDSTAYKNVISLDQILDAEDQKMSKSRGSSVDPWAVLNMHGADAFRWFFYTAAPPGQELRFSVGLVGEVLRGFTLPLWNVYAFFVAAANRDGWKSALTADASLASQVRGAQAGEEALDRWLLSELNLLICQVTGALDDYDVTGAARSIQAFVAQDLVKWYVRRSRRRFWKDDLGEDDTVKNIAYSTLYTTLVTLSKLLAPCMPFLAEALYQNLVRSFDAGAPESVHLCDWPGYDPAFIDEVLNQEMRLVMRLASLGHAARSAAEIKVRQPLAEVSFSLSPQDDIQLLKRHADLLADELNVKRVRLLSSMTDAVSYSLKPLPKQLGQKYQSNFPKVAQAIAALDPANAGPALLSGQAVMVSVDGEDLEILADEVEVRVQALSGLSIAADRPYLAALAIDLTPELAREGLAREFVRRIQELRRTADLELAERVHVFYQATPGLDEAVAVHRDMIMAEILALELRPVEPPDDAVSSEVWFDGQWLKAGLRRVDLPADG